MYTLRGTGIRNLTPLMQYYADRRGGLIVYLPFIGKGRFIQLPPILWYWIPFWISTIKTRVPLMLDTLKHRVLNIWHVTVYLQSLEWGGPEEGGWTYESRSPENASLNSTVWGFNAKTRAMRRAESIHDNDLPEWNEGRYPLESVLSDGRFIVMVENHTPKHYPDRIPHYE